jgi:cell wall-associated NlpC family hydrolase
MDESVHDLSAAYALDALDAEERAAFEAHLGGCARCQEELASFWQTAGSLAYAAAGPAPSAELRGRLLERARAERPNRSERDDSSSSSGSNDVGGSSRGSSSGGWAAVAWAKTQLGKDYQWGADGPSTYDCSGLTLQAWARQGVSLPHSSVLQYSLAEHVAISDLRVGDLVFFATDTSEPGTIHHVALYAGDGQMVEAPYTGAQVRVSSIYRSGLMPYGGRP